jgi:hypothetical protein
VLGLYAQHGRTILKGEEEAGRHAVVVLSDAFWRSRFAADPGVVGRAVALNGRPYTVVGVGPAGFPGLVRGIGVDLFVPLAMDPSLTGDSLEERGNRGLLLIGRLRQGAGIGAARAELALVGRRLHASHPGYWTNVRGEPRVVSVLPEDASRVLPMVRGPIAAFLALLFAAVGLVLLLACTNVASLLLARASARRRELAVRVALGAQRRDVVRLVVGRGLRLAGAGLAIGLVVAAFVTRFASFLLYGTSPLDPGTFAGVVALLAAAALVAAWAPARRAAGVEPFVALREG